MLQALKEKSPKLYRRIMAARMDEFQCFLSTPRRGIPSCPQWLTPISNKETRIIAAQLLRQFSSAGKIDQHALDSLEKRGTGIRLTAAWCLSTVSEGFARSSSMSSFKQLTEARDTGTGRVRSKQFKN